MGETATGIVGDMHLDLDAFERTIAGPLDGCSRIVATGDYLDRGEAHPEEMFERLLGSRVELLAGNHELAYLGGPKFPRMMEDRGASVAPLLRDLVLDGKLRAATAAHGVLCVHGGVSTAFWKAHLRKKCGDDVDAIAAELNQRFLHGVARRDFSHPVFDALRSRVRGPFWAHAVGDLLEPGLPPIRQVVGHVAMSPPARWYRDLSGGPGRLYPVEWPAADKQGGMLGHVVVRSGGADE